ALGGDEVALALLADAGQALAALATAVLARLEALNAGLNVYTTGGVFRAGHLILDPMRVTLRMHSNARVTPAEFAPIIGALFLALRAAEVALDENVIQAVRKTLPSAAIAKSQEQD